MESSKDILERIEKSKVKAENDELPHIKLKKMVLTNDKVFGPTIQGEGKYQGVKSTFVRFSGCPLWCCWKNNDGSLTYCDTPYSSIKDIEKVEMTVDEVVEEVLTRDAEHVVITGGEPFIQKHLPLFVKRLVDEDKFVTIETNGMKFLETEAQYLSISPKLNSSSHHPTKGEIHEKLRINYKALAQHLIFGRDYQLKFVVNEESDILEIEKFIEQLAIAFVEEAFSTMKMKHTDKRNTIIAKIEDLTNHTWLMPQGITEDQIQDKIKMLADMCTEKGFNLSDRLHIRIWDDERRR